QTDPPSGSLSCFMRAGSRSAHSRSWLPIPKENLDHLTPEREQLVEPLRIVVPQRSQRHSANKTEGQGDDVGCKLARDTVLSQSFRPSGLYRTSCSSRNIENLLAHRLIG